MPSAPSEVAVCAGLVDIDFSCVSAASSARHISMALERVSSACFSKRDLVLSLMTPHTNLSLIRLSVRAPNSQVLALLRRSVTYRSIVSPGCWHRVLNTCRSHVTFFLGMQYFSNFSTSLSSFFSSPGFSKESELNTSRASGPAK